MSRYHRPEADQSDRPTLPPIRDLFREELSQSPRPPYPSTNSPSFSFARLSFDDDEEASQQMSDPRRTPHSHTRRLDRPISQRSVPTPLGIERSMTPRPSTTLSTQIYSETNRDIANHPLSRSSQSGHYRSKTSNDTPFRSGTPSNVTYQTSLDQVIPSNALGRAHSGLPAVPSIPGSYSRSNSQYNSRTSRHPDVEHIPTSKTSESQTGGSGTIDRTSQGTPALSSPAAKYECNYCGKGFNRPSSLKIHLNSHTGEKPFTCTFEGCGRSFSVLSNMRRHARVHVSAPHQFYEDSSDEESNKPSPPLTSSSSSPLTPAKISSATASDSTRGAASGSYLARQDGSASNISSHKKSSR